MSDLENTPTPPTPDNGKEKKDVKEDADSSIPSEKKEDHLENNDSKLDLVKDDKGSEPTPNEAKTHNTGTVQEEKNSIVKIVHLESSEANEDGKVHQPDPEQKDQIVKPVKLEVDPENKGSIKIGMFKHVISEHDTVYQNFVYIPPGYTFTKESLKEILSIFKLRIPSLLH
jgi:hypothetical protein